ncbi:MAG: hypothetical protein KBE09_00660 [Candidatus Pacebacteria bacterium]|nr:hypothetical protein [Candidatus Paceibacterota bacterium]
MKIPHFFLVHVVTLTLTLPFFTFAQSSGTGLLRDGVFGCAAGTYGMQVGTLTAIGGVYVPVNDAAVTQNTGYLVYKECVLDGVTKRMGEAASASIVSSVLRWQNTARGGNPQFVTNQDAERLQVADKARAEYLKKYNLQNLCTPFQATVRKNAAVAYMKTTRDPNSVYSCTLSTADTGKIQNFLAGNFSAGGFAMFMETALNPQNQLYFAYEMYEETSRLAEQRALGNLTEELDWGRGNLSVKREVRTPTGTGEDRITQEIITPGYLIAELVTQAAGSGFRQLETANEIDQIVSALFSGITNQILTNAGGLQGISASQLGAAPYLDRLTAESNAGVRNAASGAGLAVLSSSLAVEEAFNKTKKDSKSLLETAASQLRRAEERCWDILIPKVREYAQTVACTTSGDPPVQSCSTPAQLRISTSTQMINRGTLAVSISSGSTVANGALYTLEAPPTAIVRSGSAQLRAAETQNFSSTTALGIPIESGPAPSPGGALSLVISSTSPFSGGALSLALQSAQVLPVGEVRFPLTPISPFNQAVVSLIVGVVQQFSEVIIEGKITPLLDGVLNDIETSNEALTQLATLAADLQNSTSVTAQRIALERLDALVAQRLLHTAYDVKDASAQKDALQGSMTLLVEDTVKEWSTGSGWCNAENPDVVRQWYERWRVQ